MVRLQLLRFIDDQLICIIPQSTKVGFLSISL